MLFRPFNPGGLSRRDLQSRDWGCAASRPRPDRHPVDARRDVATARGERKVRESPRAIEGTCRSARRASESEEAREVARSVARREIGEGDDTKVEGRAGDG